MNDISEYLTAFDRRQIWVDTSGVPGLPPGQGFATGGHRAAVVWGLVMPPRLRRAFVCRDCLAKPGARPETVPTGSEAAAVVSYGQS